jgi:hypothetical protein
MRAHYGLFALAILLASPTANAQEGAAAGAVTGVIAGAMIAGPIGAVIGGVAGAAAGGVAQEATRRPTRGRVTVRVASPEPRTVRTCVRVRRGGRPALSSTDYGASALYRFWFCGVRGASEPLAEANNGRVVPFL